VERVKLRVAKQQRDAGKSTELFSRSGVDGCDGFFGLSV
jgi:hypothetical protein